MNVTYPHDGGGPFKFGWLRDLPDNRDFKFSLHADMKTAAFPAKVDLREKCPKIKNQRTLGSCVLNWMAFNLEFIEMIELLDKGSTAPQEFGPTFAEISRLFMYYNCRAMDGQVNSDAGTHLRTAILSIRRHGIAREKLWPYDVQRVFQLPPSQVYQEAKQHKVTAGYRINHADLNQIRSCLAAGYPFGIGISLFSSFFKTGSDGIVSRPTASDQFQGGHAMTCVGYDEARRVFIVANSWDVTWGDKGYCYIPYEYFLDMNLAADFWTLRRETVK